MDVAGYADAAPVRRSGRFAGAGTTGAGRAGDGLRTVGTPRTIVVECKQTRADFLRDRGDRDRLLAMRRDLDRFRVAIEENRVKVEEPQLRRAGSSLFPDLDEWDFERSRLPAYREVLRRLRRLDRMLHGETKFWTIARYALADRLYLAAPEGMIRHREVPPGWGLLECTRRGLRDDDTRADLFGASVLHVAVTAPPQPAREQHRIRLLRNIAVAASRWTS